MKAMNISRTTSYSELSSNNLSPLDDPHVLEGVSVNLKLLLKLIHEHHDSVRESDSRRPQRIATMLAIIDDIRTRVVKSQALVVTSKPELRRCATELHRNSNNSPTKDKRLALMSDHSVTGETATGRKGLEMMFASLGKEKEVMATELSRKNQQISSMEEIIKELHARNEMLSERVRSCAAEHREIGTGNNAGSGDEVVGGLQERNRALTEQMMKSLDGIMSMKRRLREMATEAAAGVERLRVLRKKCSGAEEERSTLDQGLITDELCLIERALAGFYRRLSVMSSVPGAIGSPRDSPRNSPRESPRTSPRRMQRSRDDID